MLAFKEPPRFPGHGSLKFEKDAICQRTFLYLCSDVYSAPRFILRRCTITKLKVIKCDWEPLTCKKAHICLLIRKRKKIKETLNVVCGPLRYWQPVVQTTLCLPSAWLKTGSSKWPIVADLKHFPFICNSLPRYWKCCVLSSFISKGKWSTIQTFPWLFPRK